MLPTAKFCVRCGADMVVFRKTNPAYNATPEQRAAARQAWQRVSIGLITILVSLGIALLVLFTSVLMSVRGGATPGAVLLMIPIAMIASLAAGVGKLLCLFAPTASRAKCFIPAAVALEALAIVALLTQTASLPKIPGGLAATAMVCFIFFLKQLGVFFDRPDIESLARSVGAWGVILLAATIAAPAIIWLVFFLQYLFWAAVAVGWTVVALRYGFLLLLVWQAIRFHIENTESGGR
jgi:hypothetical protein